MPNLVEIDSLRLSQAIKHLLDNAFKFTQQGKIILKAGVTLANGKDNLQFMLQDSGLGIEQTNATSLFESFNQAESGDTRQFGGTGLGLTITKGLIELMHGKITLKSSIGKSAIFQIDIPLVNQSELKKIITNDQLKPLEIKNILIFTDQSSLKKLLKTQLASLGFNCKTLSLDQKVDEYKTIDLSSQIIFIDYTENEKLFIKTLLKECQKLALNPHHQIILLPNGETLSYLGLIHLTKNHQL